MSIEAHHADPSPEQVRLEKEKNWREKLSAVDQIADGLGLGVDTGVRETVAAFHAFGIHTTASHEGKINRYPVPYIDIMSPDVAEQNKKLEKTPYESEGWVNLRDEILRKNLAERKKIIPLLEEFYSERKVPYEVRLGIIPLAFGWSRIQSQGGEFQEVETDEEVKKQRLQQFQNEMKDFTEFLKRKYFA